MDKHAWDRRYAEAQLLWSKGPNQFVQAELESLPPGRALDVAAGEGRNAIWLAERGWVVDAVDFSRVALARGRELAAQRSVKVRWHEADVTSYEPARQGYDLVMVIYLQLPSPSMEGVLERAAGAVAPGGTFLLVGHDLENLERGHGGPSQPDVLHTPERVSAALAGLHVDKAERVERVVETEDGPRTAIDTLVRATRPIE